jgi:hypothetical protein
LAAATRFGSFRLVVFFAFGFAGRFRAGGRALVALRRRRVVRRFGAALRRRFGAARRFRPLTTLPYLMAMLLFLLRELGAGAETRAFLRTGFRAAPERRADLFRFTFAREVDPAFFLPSPDVLTTRPVTVVREGRLARRGVLTVLPTRISLRPLLRDDDRRPTGRPTRVSVREERRLLGLTGRLRPKRGPGLTTITDRLLGFLFGRS